MDITDTCPDGGACGAYPGYGKSLQAFSLDRASARPHSQADHPDPVAAIISACSDREKEIN